MTITLTIFVRGKRHIKTKTKLENSQTKFSKYVEWFGGFYDELALARGQNIFFIVDKYFHLFKEIFLSSFCEDFFENILSWRNVEESLRVRDNVGDPIMSWPLCEDKKEKASRLLSLLFHLFHHHHHHHLKPHPASST